MYRKDETEKNNAAARYGNIMKAFISIPVTAIFFFFFCSSKIWN